MVSLWAIFLTEVIFWFWRDFSLLIWKGNSFTFLQVLRRGQIPNENYDPNCSSSTVDDTQLSERDKIISENSSFHSHWKIFRRKNFLCKISYSNRNKESNGGTRFIRVISMYRSPNQIKVFFTQTNQIPCYHCPQLRLNYSLLCLQPFCPLPTAWYFPFQKFKIFFNKLVNSIKIQVTFLPIRWENSSPSLVVQYNTIFH